MRVLSGLGGLLVVLALGAGAAAYAHPTSSNRVLTASNQRLATTLELRSLPVYRSRPPRPTPAPSPPSTTAGSTSAPTSAAPVSAPRPPRIVVVSSQEALINQDRARHGLGPLTWNSCLYNVALANARRMAAAEVMSHANGVYQDLACGLGHQSGENVGYYSLGINDSLLNTDFMNSPEHRANILGPYHYVATAWAIGANGYGYIAVEFD